jgi:hypothetical protein
VADQQAADHAIGLDVLLAASDRFRREGLILREQLVDGDAIRLSAQRLGVGEGVHSDDAADVPEPFGEAADRADRLGVEEPGVVLERHDEHIVVAEFLEKGVVALEVGVVLFEPDPVVRVEGEPARKGAHHAGHAKAHHDDSHSPLDHEVGVLRDPLVKIHNPP